MSIWVNYIFQYTSTNQMKVEASFDEKEKVFYTLPQGDNRPLDGIRDDIKLALKMLREENSTLDGLTAAVKVGKLLGWKVSLH